MKMKMKIKAILIDVENQTVTDIKIEPTLKEYYRVLKCDMIEAALQADSRGDTLYVDEEGMFKDDKKYFVVAGGHHPFINNGLIVGMNEDGEDVDCKLTADIVRNMVQFVQF